MSIDECGMAHMEKLYYDVYNESDVLISAVENYHKRNGRYPKRVLADKIYRSIKNLTFCKKHGISRSGLPLGKTKRIQVNTAGPSMQMKVIE